MFLQTKDREAFFRLQTRLGQSWAGQTCHKTSGARMFCKQIEKDLRCTMHQWQLIAVMLRRTMAHHFLLLLLSHEEGGLEEDQFLHLFLVLQNSVFEAALHPLQFIRRKLCLGNVDAKIETFVGFVSVRCKLLSFLTSSISENFHGPSRII